jgi:hypothetical protein
MRKPEIVFIDQYATINQFLDLLELEEKALTRIDDYTGEKIEL